MNYKIERTRATLSFVGAVLYKNVEAENNPNFKNILRTNFGLRAIRVIRGSLF